MAESKKEAQQSLISNMEAWRKVENASISSTARVIEKTENPIVRLVMEIIQRDSQMHYRVQQWVAESLSGRAVSLAPEELGEVWQMIEEHIRLEQRTLELARASLESIKGSKGMLVQAYLLEYLLDDERKHNLMLERLAHIQKGMYPYA
jgi:phenylpropionate dioxygenase-like ring-hydroxylating dioxygenase large terminal subunit